jgi:hypothetical protein
MQWVLCGGITAKSLRAAGCDAVYHGIGDLYIHYGDAFRHAA